MNERSTRRRFTAFETVIIIVIALCMIFLNTFTITKLNELQQAKSEAVFVRDGIEFEDEELFAEEIVNYLEDTYKMIELYDENMEMLFQIQFNDGYLKKDDITEYPNIIEILQHNDEGQTTVNIDGVEQDLYFKWLGNSRGETRLLLVYSSVKDVEGIWVFNLVSCLVIFLVFVLLIVVRMSAFQDKIKQYHGTTKRIRDEMNP